MCVNSEHVGLPVQYIRSQLLWTFEVAHAIEVRICDWICEKGPYRTWVFYGGGVAAAMMRK